MKLLKNIITALAIMSLVAGCSREKPSAGEGGNLKILASFLPMYIFALNVVDGVDGVEVNLLLPPEGTGPHGYHLTPGDMKKLADADALIINGHHLDDFVGAPAKNNPKLKIIDASVGIDALPDLNSNEERREYEHEENRHHERGLVNPHLWVSPRRAAKQALNIAERLSEIDGKNAAKYRANGKAFAEKLLDLDSEFKKAVASFPNKKIVTIHNAFDYLAEDTGLKVVGVLRVNATSEPRSRELTEIIEMIRKEKPAAIFVEPQFSDKLARMLSGETGAPVYTLDPVATGEASGDYYVETMSRNLETLKKALGK